MHFIYCSVCQSIAAAHMRPYGPFCTACGAEHNYDPQGRYFGEVWVRMQEEIARYDRVFICKLHGISGRAGGNPDTGPLCTRRWAGLICNTRMTAVVKSSEGARPSMNQVLAKEYVEPEVPANENPIEREKRMARLIGVRPVWGEDQ